MVESLKRSVERLQPPGCIHCRIKMVWYRSVRAAELDEIIHYFQCVNCNRIVEVTTKMRSDENGKGSPPKLARPAHRRGKHRLRPAGGFICVKLAQLGRGGTPA